MRYRRPRHYRIGYVNMEVDYHFAKGSCTEEWIEAFVYVDVNARNIPVNNGRAEYTSGGWTRAPATPSRC